MFDKSTKGTIGYLKGEINRLRKQGQYAEAIDLAKDICKLQEREGESHSSDYAENLRILALLYYEVGNFSAAGPLYRQALDILRETDSKRYPEDAVVLNDLAGHYMNYVGDYEAAEQLFQQALDDLRETHGERHPNYAAALNNLAELYREKGDYQAAKPLFEQALNSMRLLDKEKSPEYAMILDNFSLLYRDLGDYDAAETLILQARDIFCDTIGKRHCAYAINLNNLALIYQAKLDYQAAKPLFQEAIDILRETVGEEHPDYARFIDNLAILHHEEGDWQAAEPLYLQALEIRRITLGERHPDYASSLENLARLFAATDRAVEAFDLAQRTASIYDHVIVQISSIGSESQRMTYVRSIDYSVNEFLSLVCQGCPKSGKAIRAATDLILRRKAIGAEILAVQRDAILNGKYPALREQLRKLHALSRMIAQDILAGPGEEGIESYQQRLKKFNALREWLEAELARSVPEMRLEHHLKAVDHLTVARSLPKGMTLIELIRFTPFNFCAIPARGESQLKPPRYLAFVLPARAPDKLAMIDLGDAKIIDLMVDSYIRLITGKNRLFANKWIHYDQVDQAASAALGSTLRTRIFDPLRPHLNGATHLLLAPDGELTRLPFEILPIEGGYMIDVFQLSYLSVGRDVLRFGSGRAQGSTPALVIADPDFDLSDPSVPMQYKGASPHGRYSRDLTRTLETVARLPGAAQEGREIAALLQVDPWLHQRALEGPLKATRSPFILHLATHGFFLENQQPDIATSGGSFAEIMLDRIAVSGIENPLLRSGLILSGFNTWLKGGIPPLEAEDGVLTAVDVSGLDLTDTELVVLSACDTALGDVLIGEGVFGLRRAVMLAGANTLIMSLWAVPDEATRELVTKFYNFILKSAPRAEALRNAQLAIKEKYPHPYYWGAFICQGDPSPLV